MSPEARAECAARDVATALEDVLGGDLVAVYLHGSAALGGFRWDRSDLDVLAVSEGRLSDAQFEETAAALAGLRYPAKGLELSVMTRAEAVSPHFPEPCFELHMTTAHPGKVVDGRARVGDRDLVLHMAVCRAVGIAMFGPPAGEALAKVPDELILLTMCDEIGWAREYAPVEYLVLTSARVWLFAETGRIASKIEAGEWAAARYSERGVIEAALNRQRGANAEVPMDRAEHFAHYVERITAT